MLLADFVKKRWSIDPPGICRICVHPKQEIINEIIIKKNPKTSWAVIIRQINNVIGEKFTPPQILKAHLNHIKNKKVKGNKYA
jgi:hypothetical protein